MNASPNHQGSILGRYTPDRRLVDGAERTVHAGFGPGGRVAIKLLRGPDAARRGQREATALARLSHDGIVALVDHGPVEGGYALVLDWVEGPTLGGRLKQGPVDVRFAVRVARELCAALAHAHDRGVVHGDVKAANVLLTADDEVRLIDFGIGRCDGDPLVSRDDVVLGSVHTVAPEQVRGEAIDGRADQYAVGVLLYRMVGGKYPFHAPNPAQVLAAHVHASPPPLGLGAPGLLLPPGIEDAISRCLRKSADARFATLQDLEAVLVAAERAAEDSWLPVEGNTGTLDSEDSRTGSDIRHIEGADVPSARPALQALAAALLVTAISIAWVLWRVW